MKVFQVWNDMRVSNYRQKFPFWVNEPFSKQQEINMVAAGRPSNKGPEARNCKINKLHWRETFILRLSLEKCNKYWEK